MDRDFALECPLCDTDLELLVMDNDDARPMFCPMCGTDVEWQELESFD